MKLPLVALMVFLSVTVPATGEDVVELLSGAKLTGVVTEIRKTDKEFDFEAKLGSRTIQRTYPFAKVHAVTMKGQRYTLTPMSTAASNGTDSTGKVIRTQRQIEELIQTVGSSVPDWFESTPMDYPDTLDLSWPIKPPDKGWNNQKNMGQYIWDVINPNPARWRSGLKLVHHCMSLHQGNSTLVRRDMQVVGRFYFELLQDYPRAAYWLRRAGAKPGEKGGVMLAECYWRLGNKQMALKQLTARTFVGPGATGTIKLYGNLGVVDQALRIAELMSRTNAAPEGYLAAGDALRQDGQFDRAIAYYRKVLSDDGFRNKDYEQRYKSRAQESIEAIELFEQVDVSSISDGTYRDSSTGYNGKLDVSVEISGGQIGSVKVTQHREKQFYSALTDTENQIIERQSVRGVDGTTGATITSRAIVNATAKALASATP